MCQPLMVIDGNQFLGNRQPRNEWENEISVIIKT